MLAPFRIVVRARTLRLRGVVAGPGCRARRPPRSLLPVHRPVRVVRGAGRRRARTGRGNEL